MTRTNQVAILGNLFTVWKFQDFTVNQILREIKFGHIETQKLPFIMGVFDLQKSAKIDFT